MSDASIFYQIEPTTMNPCELSPDSHTKVKQTWLCAGCGNARPDVQGIDIQIDRSTVKDGPLNFAAYVPIVQRSFLYQMGEHIADRDLMLGRVYSSNGTELDDWRTYHARRNVIVRGSDDPNDENDQVKFWCCNECGRLVYSAGGIRYLFPDPPNDAEIYETALGLLVPDYLFSSLVIPKKAKVYVKRLKVINPPLDGFGVLGNWETDRSKWGTAHRSMRGCTRLTDSLLRQGAEDVEAIKRGTYRSVFWHFFADAATGRIEIAPDLLEAVERSGIKCVFHE